jgi:hypothetical protein
MHLDFFLKRRDSEARRARRRISLRRRALIQSETVPRADVGFLEYLRLCVSVPTPLHGSGTDTSKASG